MRVCGVGALYELNRACPFCNTVKCSGNTYSWQTHDVARRPEFVYTTLLGTRTSGTRWPAHPICPQPGLTNTNRAAVVLFFEFLNLVYLFPSIDHGMVIFRPARSSGPWVCRKNAHQELFFAVLAGTQQRLWFSNKALSGPRDAVSEKSALPCYLLTFLHTA